MVRFTAPFGQPRRPSSAARFRIESSSSGHPHQHHQQQRSGDSNGRRRDGAGSSSTAAGRSGSAGPAASSSSSSALSGTLHSSSGHPSSVTTTTFTVESPVASLHDLPPESRRRVGLETRVTCDLCEATFPVGALRGRISYKAILEQRARWGLATLLRRELAPAVLYSERRTCVFCSQFFDEDVLRLEEEKDCCGAAGQQVDDATPSLTRPGVSTAASDPATSWASGFDASVSMGASTSLAQQVLKSPGTRPTSPASRDMPPALTPDQRPHGAAEAEGAVPTTTVVAKTPPRPLGTHVPSRRATEAQMQRAEATFYDGLLRAAARRRQEEHQAAGDAGRTRAHAVKRHQQAALVSASDRDANGSVAMPVNDPPPPSLSVVLRSEFGSHGRRTSALLERRAQRTNAGGALTPTRLVQHARRVYGESPAGFGSSGSPGSPSPHVTASPAHSHRQSDDASRHRQHPHHDRPSSAGLGTRSKTYRDRTVALIESAQVSRVQRQLASRLQQRGVRPEDLDGMTMDEIHAAPGTRRGGGSR